jgi:uncharacterized protein (DUF2236 family)
MRQRIVEARGTGWFAEDRPIQRVHGDAAMLVGGLRALLLQSLHPLAMAAVAEHSGYRADPWGRLQRTSRFLAVTTYGSAADAQRSVDAVRAVHTRVHGVAPDGRAYRADDPELLEWVHIAEIDSFLRCHQRYGAEPLDPDEADQYVTDTALIASKLGVPDPPLTRAELAQRIAGYRKDLAGTEQARAAARFLLLHPPLPYLARAPYAVLAAAAIAELPAWARWPLRLPYLPISEATTIPAIGHVLVRTTRWVLSAPGIAPGTGRFGQRGPIAEIELRPGLAPRRAQRASRSRIASVTSSGASSARKWPARVRRWSRSGAQAFHTPAAS